MPLHVTDTRVASCLLALGFAGQVQPTIHTQSGKTHLQVSFEGPSTRFPQLDPVLAVRHWQDNRFLRDYFITTTPDAPPTKIPAQPMHMLAVMMRAQESYDAFLKLQKEGGGMYLWTDDPGRLFYRYTHSIFNPCEAGTVILDDLNLAACLGPLGIGIVKLHGEPGQRSYEMAALGLGLTDSAGATVNYRTADLIRLSTQGHHLAVQDVNPHHTLVLSYDALYARHLLKKEILRAQANLLITANDGTAKQALIALDYKGHVGAAVCRHMKAPSGSLGLS